MLFESTELTNGSLLKNRLVKAAMEENLATADRLPSARVINLYRRWAEGGVGMSITGNVMIDGRYLTGPGGIVLERDTPLAAFKEWATEGTMDGTQLWMQINHPGRQTPSSLATESLAPSAINVDLGKYSKMIAPAKAMNGEQILDVINRFVATAKQAEAAGFSGVQIHGAHGYLIGQFLSPLTNKRRDDWGGSLANRARLLLQVVRQIRASVSPEFGVAVKLNSADFQRGGFEPEDALQVVKWLEPLGVDFVELSGGSYEAPAMQGDNRDDRTLAREAYFLEFAETIAANTQITIMTTGGIKRLNVANAVLESGVGLVGVATGLALQPELPSLWQTNPEFTHDLPPLTWKNKSLTALAKHAQVRVLLKRQGDSKKVRKPMPYWLAMVWDQCLQARSVKQYKAWLSATSSLSR